jgi:hypothetical protein
LFTSSCRREKRRGKWPPAIIWPSCVTLWEKEHYGTSKDTTKCHIWPLNDIIHVAQINGANATLSLARNEHAPTTFLNKKNKNSIWKIPKHPHEPSNYIKKNLCENTKVPPNANLVFFFFSKVNNVFSLYIYKWRKGKKTLIPQPNIFFYPR